MGNNLKYKCGIVSISFREHTPKEIIVAASEAGLSCIEWGSDVHAPTNDEDKLKSIVKLQNDYGIYCSSYGTYFRLGRNSMDELISYIKAAKLLGTNIMRVWCGEKAAEFYTDKEKEYLFGECKKAARIAEENGVILCMECHHSTFTETHAGMTELMTTVNSPNFAMYWQPNQYVSQEQNFEYAQSAKSYCKCIHVFNWERDDKFPLSEAKDLWKKYLTIINETDTLLLEFMPDDNINSLKRETDSLFEIIKEMK